TVPSRSGGGGNSATTSFSGPANSLHNTARIAFLPVTASPRVQLAEAAMSRQGACVHRAAWQRAERWLWCST
ncbi:MAG TPA: hypothetical protein VFK49_04940, partial [Stellaceae bacterium]|nr:hypothetical protein [Stellaceae bacterium]